jgi:glycerol-3-phosphate acyltransferase PlsX
MKIAVDAMGGDYAPSVTVEGSVLAAGEGVPVILVGDRERVESELSKHDTKDLPLSVKHAPEVVGMDESPVQAVRKKKLSSINVCYETVKSGEARAVVSAGNSGAAMAAGMLLLKKLKGIERPAIAVCIPTLKKKAVILDVGGNVDCKPLHLLHFAIMGDVYAKYVLRYDRPRVGLLSNAEEEGKGNELTRLTHAHLKKSSLNYLGHVEGKDIFRGDCDVIVSDGFVGNVVLKLSEGLAETVNAMLKMEIDQSLLARLGYFLADGAVKRLKQKMHYSEYGGAPLLGIDGNCIIAHGVSSSKAIKNAIYRASEYAHGRVNERLVDEIEKNSNIIEQAQRDAVSK